MNTTNENPPQPVTGPEFTRGKRVAFLSSLAMIGAVLWPVHQNWRTKPKDSFPLSYYPMFSAKRDAVETFNYLVGLDAEGKRYLIPHTFAGAGGLNAVRRQVNRLVREGKSQGLAYKLARKVATREKEPWSKIVSVSVVTGKYAVDDWFHGKKDPVSERIRATAPVERKKTPDENAATETTIVERSPS
jgi:hypothetical protein